MRLLLELASSCEDAVRTQRVLPYYVAMLSDASPLVRAEAIGLTSALLASVDTLQPSDTRVMPDYVLPALSRAAHDPEELVRCALASHIAALGETARRFVEIAQWMRVVSLRREPQRAPPKPSAAPPAMLAVAAALAAAAAAAAAARVARRRRRSRASTRRWASYRSWSPRSCSSWCPIMTRPPR